MVERYGRIYFKEMKESLKLELMGLPEDYPFSMQELYEGVVHNESSLTMISKLRLDNLEKLVREVCLDNTEGNIIETGVWRGGACILISKLLTYFNSDKIVYVADSFEGLPKPDPKYLHDKDDYHHNIDFLSVDLETVQANLEKFNCDHNYKFIKGWFKNTLHLIDDKFSLIRLDGDMYESTINALDALYPKLSVGGYCIIDDYKGVYQCPIAVDNYRKEHNITEELMHIDNTAVYWQKTK